MLYNFYMHFEYLIYLVNNQNNQIIDNYYEEIDKQSLADSAIDGMMNYLDEKYSLPVVFGGSLKTGQTIRFMSSGSEYKIENCGIFKLKLEETGEIGAGAVGYFIAGIKTVSDVRVGDTVTSSDDPAEEPLAGFKEVKPVVFSSE